MSDETKRLILARRARFVAAALATSGIATASCDACDPAPKPCLSVVAPPMPCLSPPPMPVDAMPADAGATIGPPLPPPDASSDDASGQVPRPCLKIAPPR